VKFPADRIDDCPVLKSGVPSFSVASQKPRPHPVPVDGFTWQYFALFVIGGAAGFVDAIAGGGGLLTVPALLAAGLPPQLALGTNKLQSSCGTALATFNYARAGLIAWRDWIPGIAMTAAASIAGALTATAADPSHLRKLIPVALVLLAAYTAFKPDLGAGTRPARMKRLPFSLILGSALGFYDGFLGPGTGSFWMMACVLIQGLHLTAATGVTKMMNLSSNLGSLGLFLLAGKVDFRIGLLMAAGQLIGAYAGSRIAIRQGPRLIRPVFLTVVLALAAKLAWESFRPPEKPVRGALTDSPATDAP